MADVFWIPWFILKGFAVEVTACCWGCRVMLRLQRAVSRQSTEINLKLSSNDSLKTHNPQKFDLGLKLCKCCWKLRPSCWRVSRADSNTADCVTDCAVWCRHVRFCYVCCSILPCCSTLSLLYWVFLQSSNYGSFIAWKACIHRHILWPLPCSGQWWKKHAVLKDLDLHIFYLLSSLN